MRKSGQAHKPRAKEFQDIVEHSTDLISRWDDSLRFIYVNPRITDFTGEPPSAFIGKTIYEAIPVRPDVTLVEKTLKKTLATCTIQRVQFRMQPPDFKSRIIDLTMIPEETGASCTVLGIARDITEMQEAKKAVEQSELRYKSIITTSLDGFWQIDLRGRFLDVNDSECRMLGYDREEFLRLKVADIEVIEDIDAVKRHIEMIKKKGSDRFESRHRRRDGALIDVEISTNFVKDERGERIYAFIRDISKRKEADSIVKRDRDMLDRLVAERSRKLLDAQRELERSRRLSDIGQLAATVAHELRNPLSAIEMAAFNINRKVGSEKISANLGTIERKIRESTQIISDVLTYARIKPPELRRVKMSEIIRECLDSAQKKIEQCKARVSVNLEQLDDVLIEADPLQIREVFNNIIDNACDAVRGIEGRQAAIEIDGGPAGEQVCVEVKDNGIGMDKETLRQLMKPFFTTKSQGTGLGLTVSQQIVDLHDGKIEIKSEKGKGTSVTVTLPSRHKGSKS